MISLSTEERNLGCMMSVYHDVGMAVSRAVRMECGMAAMSMELLSGFVSEESEEPDEAVITASLAETRAVEERRSVARILNCIVAAVLKKEI